MNWFKEHPHTSVVILLLLLSGGLRFGLWAQLGGEPQIAPDSISYLVPAANLIEQGTFINSSGIPETTRTPGYPLFLSMTSLIETSGTFAMAVQHMLSLGMALLIGWLLIRHKAPVEAIVAGGLIAINFILILYSNFVLSEILFGFMTTTSIALLAYAPLVQGSKIKLIAIAAIIAGLSALVRPIGLFLFLPATLYIVSCLSKQRLVLLGIFFILFAMAPASWMIRNHGITGQYTLSSISDINILGYQAAGTLAIKEGGDYATAHNRINKKLMAKAYQESVATERPLNIIYREMGLQIIKQNPVSFIQHLAQNSFTTLLGNGATHIVRLTGTSSETARLICMVYTVPALLFALYGLLICWKRHRHLAILSFLFIGYFVGITAVGGVGGSRFRIPVEPLYSMLIAFAVVDLFKRITAQRS